MSSSSEKTKRKNVKALDEKNRKTNEGEDENSYSSSNFSHLIVEKFLQIIFVAGIILVSTLVSFLQSGSTWAAYVVIFPLPIILMTRLFKIKGFNPGGSDISSVVLLWYYWIVINYVFFVIDFKIEGNLLLWLPLGILAFCQTLLARYPSCTFFLIGLTTTIILLPVEESGIFREIWWITLLRLLFYFTMFYIVEMTTYMSGMYSIPFISWILVCWPWLWLAILVEIVIIMLNNSSHLLSALSSLFSRNGNNANNDTKGTRRSHKNGSHASTKNKKTRDQRRHKKNDKNKSKSRSKDNSIGDNDSDSDRDDREDESIGDFDNILGGGGDDDDDLYLTDVCYEDV